jgi:hypothetical protein
VSAKCVSGCIVIAEDFNICLKQIDLELHETSTISFWLCPVFFLPYSFGGPLEMCFTCLFHIFQQMKEQFKTLIVLSHYLEVLSSLTHVHFPNS